MMRGRHVEAPRHPLGLRREQITEFERLLWIEPDYNKESPAEFTVKYDSDDSTLITVTGKKYGDRRVREFRDSSGLPLFETQRVRPAIRWMKPWRVHLPGNDEDLAEIKLKWKPCDFDITFRNVMANGAKKEEDKLATVQVRRTSPALCTFAVYAEDRKVVDIRESVILNRTVSITGNMTRVISSSHQPTRAIVEVLVAEDFDLSLASLIAILICDQYFRHTPPTRFETNQREKRLNPLLR